MKKSSLFFAAFLFAAPVSAQNHIGLVGGVNLANLRVDPKLEGPDLSNRLGFGAGGVLEFGLSENVALRFEPIFLQKGAKQKGSQQLTDEQGNVLGTVDVELTIKASFIEVPALLKIALGTKSTRPYIAVGPTVGLLLSNKVSIKASGLGVNVEDEQDLKDESKSIDFGVTFGAGLTFAAGSNSVFFEGRYALGLTNLNDDPNDPNTDIKSKGIQIMGGITFPLGGQ